MNTRLIITLVGLGFIGSLVGFHIGKQAVATENPLEDENRNSLRHRINPVRLERIFDRLQNENLTAEARYGIHQDLNRASLKELEELFLQLITKINNDQNDRLRKVLEVLIAKDGAYALELIEKHYPAHKLPRAYWTLIHSWGRSNPQATLNFLQNF